MSLVVEDGTGLETAESYCSVADADTYHANRGNTSWANLAQSIKEQCLRKATDYMTQVYGLRWKGARIRPLTQRLDWPRWDAVVDDIAVGYESVPGPVIDACASLALRAYSGPLAPDISQQRESLSVGQVKVNYAKGAAPYTQYREVDNMLAKYLGTGKSGIRILRS